MKNFLQHIFFFSILFLTGCASTAEVPLKIHAINSLTQNTEGLGEFNGLEFLADVKSGDTKSRINIFYIHGIGWTENPEADQIAEDFLGGIAKAYGRDVEGQIITSSCGAVTPDGEPAPNAVFLTPEMPKRYETALAGSSLTLNKFACMDKQVLEVNPALEFVVYRVFWDDIFWNTFQFSHVGQDDAQGSSLPFAKLRRKYNRRLKDELMTYGISDAVMYLGEAGKDIRFAIEGAMCSAALDAAGYSFDRQTLASPSNEVDAQKICTLASNTSTVSNQFAFVAESLGSKVIYDVLQKNMTDGTDSIIDDMITGSETYMLANQIALLSLSDLRLNTQQARPAIVPIEKRPKIVAMSELNDFLTYELIPFYKQLYKRSTRSTSGRTANDSENMGANISEILGFNIIDIRLEFADKVVPVLKGFVDPLQAHGGHANEPELMLHILCGARNGQLNREGCLATDLSARNAKK